MKRIKTLIFFCLLLFFMFSITVKAEGSDPLSEPVIVRCTCYIDKGITASGQYTRPNTMAAKREWIGYVACINAINEDGSIGEFIGFFEITDTGYGRETGRGESQIIKGKTLGTIETGETIDIWQKDMASAREWVNKYSDYVYIKIIDGKG